MSLFDPVVMVVEVGIPGPAGPQGSSGQGFTQFATTAEMFLTTGSVGEIAHCADNPDQHWKWSTNQGTWVPAF